MDISVLLTPNVPVQEEGHTFTLLSITERTIRIDGDEFVCGSKGAVWKDYVANLDLTVLCNRLTLRPIHKKVPVIHKPVPLNGITMDQVAKKYGTLPVSERDW